MPADSCYVGIGHGDLQPVAVSSRGGRRPDLRPLRVWCTEFCN